MIKHRDQKLLVKEFISAYKSQVILLREVRKGIQGTNCEAEAEAKATEKCSSDAFFFSHNSGAPALVWHAL